MRLAFLSWFLLALSAGGSAAAPLILQKPTVSKTRIVFVYAGDLWSVPRAGGDAVRLTTGPGIETHPIFNPDGSCQYDVEITLQDNDGSTPIVVRVRAMTGAISVRKKPTGGQ